MIISITAWGQVESCNLCRKVAGRGSGPRLWQGGGGVGVEGSRFLLGAGFLLLGGAVKGGGEGRKRGAVNAGPNVRETRDVRSPRSGG